MSKEFSVDQMRELIGCVAANEISELLYENEGVRLRIRGKQVVEQVLSADGPTAVFTVGQSACAPAPTNNSLASVISGTASGFDAPAGEGKCITSPLVGTFYSASSPDKPAFIQVGETIQEGDIVFIVESMKVMNEVPADKSGVVAEILVDNGAPVEYGQAILRLE